MTAPTCAEISELLPEFAFGILAAEERAGVVAHLDVCASCRADLFPIPEPSPPEELVHVDP